MSVYTVYRTTNVTNGMFYIGVHKAKNPNDDYIGSGKRLKYAVKKYGVESFQKDVLFIFSTPEEAYAKEKELVTEEVLDSGKCYNLKLGGYGGWDFLNDGSPSHINRTKLAGRLGGVLSIERLISLTQNRSQEEKTRIGKKISSMVKNRHNPMIGNVHTEKSKMKMKERASSMNNTQFGSMWITNGILNKKIKKDQEIPEGWKCGRKC